MKKIYSFLLAAVLMLCCNISALADDAHPWAGTYTVKATDVKDYENSSAAAYGVEILNEFRVTISWVDDAYKVTEFYNYDLTGLKDGGIPFTVDEKDDKYATIQTKRVMFGVVKQFPPFEYDGVEYPAEDIGLTLWGRDGNSTTPITVTRQSDGQIKLDGFTLWLESSLGYGGGMFAAYDKCVPLNGGDPEETFDFTGFYKVTADIMKIGSIAWPKNSIFEIRTDEWGTYVAQMFGYDTATTNYNQISVSANPKNPTAARISYMDDFNTIARIDGVTYELRSSSEGGMEPISISYDAKTGKVSFSSFVIWNRKNKSMDAYVLEATGVKMTEDEVAGIAGVAVDNSTSSKTRYNVAGQPVASPAKGQIIITNGKKYAY